MTVKRTVQLLITFILFISLPGCASMFSFSKNKTKFDWSAQVSGYPGYSMRLISGTFYYHDEKGGLYIPDGIEVDNNSWGSSNHVHAVGDDYKALPDRLDIRFFSFPEGKFYQGSFDLPYEKILKICLDAVAANNGERVKFYIVAGVVPGGKVAVWVTGKQRTTEVFWGQAEEYEDDFYTPGGLLYEGDELREYINRRINEMPKEVQEQIRKQTIPFGMWDKLRTRFYFAPSILADFSHSSVDASYVNGESHEVDMTSASDEKSLNKAVPILYSFKYRKPDGNSSRPVVIRFNFDELFQVFKKLGADKQLVHIEMNPVPPEGQSHVRVHNDTESIWLKEYSIRY